MAHEVVDADYRQVAAECRLLRGQRHVAAEHDTAADTGQVAPRLRLAGRPAARRGQLAGAPGTAYRVPAARVPAALRRHVCRDLVLSQDRGASAAPHGE